jgi:hypothetical protein
MPKYLRSTLACALVACGVGLLVTSPAGAQVCEDPARTVYGGGPGSEGCLQYPTPGTCEMAWVDGDRGPASCYFDDTSQSCFGCGPNNESAGSCTNTCTMPPEPPNDGVPSPCTIGFWKNRADTPMGQGQHFPDPAFDQVVAAAASLSPLFTDSQELLDALGTKGRRSDLERAEQQLAAVLLNLAAGDLFANDDKCALFDGNEVFDNSCEGVETVGEALGLILVDMDAGEFEHAKNCADDLNNGIGVVDANVAD